MPAWPSSLTRGDLHIAGRALVLGRPCETHGRQEELRAEFSGGKRLEGMRWAWRTLSGGGCGTLKSAESAAK
eukprot:1567427-Heterocapsa_arctica.AAC.1